MREAHPCRAQFDHAHSRFDCNRGRRVNFHVHSASGTDELRASVAPTRSKLNSSICGKILLSVCCILSGARAEDWNKDYQALYTARDQNNMKACIDKGEAMLKV